MRGAVFFRVGLAVMLLTTLLAGCASPVRGPEETPKTIALHVGQFPDDRESYKLVVDLWKGNEFLEERDLGTTVRAGMDWTSMTLPPGTTQIALFLLPDAQSMDPDFFDAITVGSASDYGSFYWLDYDEYFNSSNPEFVYGISSEAEVSLAGIDPLTLSFSWAPYFLLGFSNSAHSLLNINHASTAPVAMAMFDSVASVSRPSFDSDYAESDTIVTEGEGVLYFESKDYAYQTQSQISFNETKTLRLSVQFTNMLPTEDPNLLYGIAFDDTVYAVHPQNETAELVGTITSDFMTMRYSRGDRKLYGYASSSSSVVVFDPATGETEDIVMDEYFVVGGLDTDPEGRLFVVVGGELVILDLKTREELGRAEIESRSGICYSPLLDSVLSIDGVFIRRYSVEDNSITVNDDVYMGLGIPDMVPILDPSGQFLVYRSSHDASIVLVDLSSMTEHIFEKGEAYPQNVRLGADQHLYYCWSDTLFVRHGSSYSQLSTSSLPVLQFELNADASRLVGFNGENASLYFVRLTTEAPAAAVRMGHALPNLPALEMVKARSLRSLKTNWLQDIRKSQGSN